MIDLIKLIPIITELEKEMRIVQKRFSSFDSLSIFYSKPPDSFHAIVISFRETKKSFDECLSISRMMELNELKSYYTQGWLHKIREDFIDKIQKGPTDDPS